MITGYRAVVLGVTGAVGSALVRELCQSSRCAAVVLLTRRHVDLLDSAPGASKLVQHVIDLNRLEQRTAELAQGSDVAFCALGTGQPSKVSKEELWKVDVDYAAAFARGSKTAGVQHISLLGAVSADAGSRTYCLRVKGKAEEALRSQDFARCSLFRPSLLVTKELRYGLQDRVTQWGFPRVSRLLPSRYREIRVEDLARAMRVNAERGQGRAAVDVLHHDDFLALLGAESTSPARAAQ